MDNDQLVRKIDELERALRRDDPSLSKRLNQLQRRDKWNDVAVFSLLTLSAVLLATALATLSPAAGGAGVVAYLASFLVDRRHQRQLTGMPQDGRTGNTMAVTPTTAGTTTRPTRRTSNVATPEPHVRKFSAAA
jgi:Protein of unknown function (DUF3040)